MPAKQDKLFSGIIDLLRRTRSVWGMRVVFKSRIPGMWLPPEWDIHNTMPCREFKQGWMAENHQNHPQPCIEFDVIETPKALQGLPEGRIHTCPAGFTEIAVPVDANGLYAGTLFAGPCWTGDGAPPHPELLVPPSEDWLEDRRVLLRGVARSIGDLIAGRETKTVPDERKRLLLDYIEQHLEERITISDLARAVSLSESRTGHLVKDLFHQTVPQLVNTVKLHQAAYLLTSTHLPIGEIAYRVGIEDQNYFSRIFSREMGVSPRTYRKRHARER
jgi:AraC-like DNA-binding protein